METETKPRRESRRDRRARERCEASWVALQPTQAQRQAHALAAFQASLAGQRVIDQQQFDTDGLPRFAYDTEAVA